MLNPSEGSLKSELGCRRPWEATSALLADVGLILEYADALGGGDQPSRSAALALQDSKCMQHVAHLARRRLPDFCELGWSALTAQVACQLYTPSEHVVLCNTHCPAMWIAQCPVKTVSFTFPSIERYGMRAILKS